MVIGDEEETGGRRWAGGHEDSGYPAARNMLQASGDLTPNPFPKREGVPSRSEKEDRNCGPLFWFASVPRSATRAAAWELELLQSAFHGESSLDHLHVRSKVRPLA